MHGVREVAHERTDMSHVLGQDMARLLYRSYQEVLCVIHVLRAKSALQAEEIRLKLDAVFHPVFKKEDVRMQKLTPPQTSAKPTTS